MSYKWISDDYNKYFQRIFVYWSKENIFEEQGGIRFGWSALIQAYKEIKIQPDAFGYHQKHLPVVKVKTLTNEPCFGFIKLYLIAYS